MSRSALAHLAAALGIAVLAAALYAPFLDNPRVFDDVFFFSGRKFAYYATHPLGLELRVPAYFTLAVTEVLWSGVMEAQRIVGLILHICAALALYRLLLELQRATLPAALGADASLRSAIGAAAFALHPVAVYGAGYLVQRTIVMATLSTIEGSFCPFCVAWYVLNLGIFASAWLARNRGHGATDIIDDATGNTGFVALGAFVVALVLGVWLHNRELGRRQAEEEKVMEERAPEIARSILEKQETFSKPPLQIALERRNIPFVVITGYPRVLVRRDARQHVLTKPISPNALCETVKKACR